MSDNSGIMIALESIKDELKRDHKRLDSIDDKLDNHITTIEHRLTEIETNIKNMKWMYGIILAAVIGIFGMIFAQMVI